VVAGCDADRLHDRGALYRRPHRLGPSRTLIDTDYSWRAVVLAWSPDGKALVLGTGDYNTDTCHPDKLVVVNADGSGLSAIPNVKGWDTAWRPQ
jgi:hypothetical protein